MPPCPLKKHEKQPLPDKLTSLCNSIFIPSFFPNKNTRYLFQKQRCELIKRKWSLTIFLSLPQIIYRSLTASKACTLVVIPRCILMAASEAFITTIIPRGISKYLIHIRNEWTLTILCNWSCRQKLKVSYKSPSFVRQAKNSFVLH